MPKVSSSESVRTKKRNQVKDWLEQSSSCSSRPEKHADNAASKNSHPVPAINNLLPCKRRQAWGYICGQNFQITTFEMFDHEVTFGRNSSCGFVYDGEKHNIPAFINNISKLHFTLHNCVESVFLEDHSMHGTFVNGTQVAVAANGKKQVLLQSGDRISVVTDKGPGFFFYHLKEKVEALDSSMPAEIAAKYLIASRLGQGASAQVFLIKDKVTFKTYALKKLVASSKRNGINSNKYIENEIKIISSVQHDNIVKLKKVVSHGAYTYIVMEKMGDSLQGVLRSCETIPMHGVQLLAYQMLMALDYLHSKHIIHRDLKPGNILTTSCDVAGVKFKLADFGLAKIVSLSQDAQTTCGTHSYMAPEIKDRDHQASYTSKVDIWSLGATLYLSVCNNKFSKEEGATNFKDDVWTNGVPWQARNCIKSMLVTNPELRPTARELLDSSWFNDEEFEDFKDIKNDLISAAASKYLQVVHPHQPKHSPAPIVPPRLVPKLPSANKDASSGSKHPSPDAPCPRLGVFKAMEKYDQDQANTAARILALAASHSNS